MGSRVRKSHLSAGAMASDRWCNVGFVHLFTIWKSTYAFRCSGKVSKSSSIFGISFNDGVGS